MSAPAGLDKMLKRLSDAPVKAREGLRGCFVRDGATLVAEMQAKVHQRTGTLARSIKSVPAKSGIGVQITAGGQATRKKIRKAVKDKDAAAGKGVYDYALALEFGNSHERAHPFFFPTLRAAKAGLKQGAQDAVNKALK